MEGALGPFKAMLLMSLQRGKMTRPITADMIPINLLQTELGTP
jgi:hypothetical protein